MARAHEGRLAHGGASGLKVRVSKEHHPGTDVLPLKHPRSDRTASRGAPPRDLVRRFVPRTVHALTHGQGCPASTRQWVETRPRAAGSARMVGAGAATEGGLNEPWSRVAGCVRHQGGHATRSGVCRVKRVPQRAVDHGSGMKAAHRRLWHQAYLLLERQGRPRTPTRRSVSRRFRRIWRSRPPPRGNR